MVYIGKSQSKMDLGVPPFQETTQISTKLGPLSNQTYELWEKGTIIKSQRLFAGRSLTE
jgi:hypothetical protein